MDRLSGDDQKLVLHSGQGPQKKARGVDREWVDKR